VSDLVTELRREVVTAHARHRVGAVRTRRRRRRPILAGAVALAVLLVAVVWTLRSLPPPQQSTEPRVVTLLRVGGDPADGVFAAGSLRVADYRVHQVVRIDPARRRVTARIPVGKAPESLATDDRSVWVNSTSSEGGSTLWRIDGGTGDVVGHVDTSYGIGLAVTPGRLWLARRDDQHSVDVFSTADGRRIARIPFEGIAGIASAGDSVWVARSGGTVTRIGEGTGRIEHSWPQLGSSAFGWGSGSIAADRSGAWIVDSGRGRLLRLEGNEVVRTLAIGHTKPILARSNGLWVVTRDDPRASAIERIDPRNGKVTATVSLGKHYPRALVPVPGGLWVIAGDGTALLIDT
jgi:DNA-binding beta-propeller fold protein YncE